MPTPHGFVVFLHVSAAMGMLVTLAIEWLSLRGLARATTYEQARDWAGLWNLLLPVGLPAVLLAVASGIYLATTLGAWELGWVRVAVPTIVLIALAGASVGPRRNRLRSALTVGAGALPGDLHRQLRHPLLGASWRCRAALSFGLLFLMTVRPESGVTTIGAFALIGVVWSLPAWGNGSV
ncbi:MAG TPA: hypothetical protein VHT95_05975 [Vicinamibacterales bacterium]|nr:hypothetical protein [Vicinamibacterales bacterium]